MSKNLWGSWEKLLENGILYFCQNCDKIYFYIRPIWFISIAIIWFISIAIPYENIFGWLDFWLTNYFKDYTQICKFKENIFHSIVLHDSIFFIPLSIFNRNNWLKAYNLPHSFYKETRLWKIITDLYPLLPPLSPKFQSYVEWLD